MTFDAKETSGHASAPVEFYQFSRTAGETTTYWRYVNAPTNREFNGETYLALPGLQRGEIASSGEAGSMQVELTLPRTCALAVELRAPSRPEPFAVTIFRSQKGEDDAEAVTIHFGEIGGVLFFQGTCQITCFSESAAWAQSLGRVHFQRTCPHVVYDEFCGASIPNGTYTGEILAIDATRRILTIDAAPNKWPDTARDEVEDESPSGELEDHFPTHPGATGWDGWEYEGFVGWAATNGQGVRMYTVGAGGSTARMTGKLDWWHRYLRFSAVVERKSDSISGQQGLAMFVQDDVSGWEVDLLVVELSRVDASNIRIAIRDIPSGGYGSSTVLDTVDVAWAVTDNKRLICQLTDGTLNVFLSTDLAEDDPDIADLILTAAVPARFIALDPNERALGCWGQGIGGSDLAFPVIYVESPANPVGAGSTIFRAGVLTHDDQRYFITKHTATEIRLQTPLSADAIVTDVISLLAGCNRSPENCRNIHDNLPRFGGFPLMPERNPWTRVT